METICEKIIRDAGGPKKLADALNLIGAAQITPQAISQWKRVPPNRVVAVEAVTGVSRHILRPDVFGDREFAA